MYKRAVECDFDCLKKLADYYNNKGKYHKALKWYIYGAQNQDAECMRQVCLQVMSSHLFYPEDKRESIVILALYWAEKYKDACKTDNNEEQIEYSENLNTTVKKMVAAYVLKSHSFPDDFNIITVPSI